MKRWFPNWIIPLIIVFSIITVWLRLAVVKTTYTINQIEKITSNAKHEKEQTSLRFARLRSPRRLESLSKLKFKLEQPKSEQVVYIK